MTLFDWLLVIVLNGSVILYALWKGRGAETSSDWFLAGRSLPWWMIGLSLYATAIDSTDIVMDSGATYHLGFRYLVVNWVGVVGGWVLMANWIIRPMYRRGMYTNSEYLEARFGLSVRVLSVLVQVLYRTVVIGMIGTTNFLTFSIVCGWSPQTSWAAVGIMALLATVYTNIGGLKTVALTDALQSIVMFTASVVIFLLVWNHLDGWSGIQERLAVDGELKNQILRIGSDYVSVEDAAKLSTEQIERVVQGGATHAKKSDELTRTSSSWLICLNLIIAGVAYAIVNHTQSMRLLGAKSQWHISTSVVLASVILLVVTFLNLTMGVMGRAMFPQLDLMPVESSLQRIDSIYPIMIRELAPWGLRGLIIAGIFAASFSTYDSIGATISALITRDIYGRVLVKNQRDEHYLWIGRWLTPVIIFGSFLYVPLLLAEGMVVVYLNVVGSFVVPLLAVYLMGSLTRAHRASAIFGLSAGVGYGILALAAPGLLRDHGISVLPAALRDGFATGPMAFIISISAMILVSSFKGWSGGDLEEHQSEGWLKQSQDAVGAIVDHDDSTTLLPTMLGIAVLVVGVVLSFVIFW